MYHAKLLLNHYDLDIEGFVHLRVGKIEVLKRLVGKFKLVTGQM